MRVVILGAGVVGVTTAYQLQKDGHEVVLIDRQPVAAGETSWGNAGMIAPGHSFVWSSPKAPMILLKSLALKDQALRFRFSLDPHLYTWSCLFLRECTSEKARRNTLLKHRLASYSQRVLQDVVGAESLDYDRNDRGILYFHRSQQALDLGVEHMKLLESDGQEIRVLSREQVVEMDPALSSVRQKIAGAIYCPTDETGDAAKFTRGLARVVVARGGELKTGTVIERLNTSGDRITGVQTDHGEVRGDLYVLALGSYSPIIARRAGLRLPIYPVKGYSLTIPIGNHASPPALAVLDEHNLVAISRFGDRIRVTATAEFAGYDTSHKPADFRFMAGVTQELYPDGGDYAQAEMWAGLRPMTPSNLPIFGRKKYQNLFLNTGHGHIGWTMSHGSARITADLIGGRTPEIPMDGLVLN